jgi:hypothetical protein
VRRFSLACAAIAIGVLSTLTLAQSPARRLTTLEALRRYPGYYHLQSVVVRGEFAGEGSRIRFRADDRDMDVLLAEGVRTTGGPVEVRGQLYDVGRFEQGDLRLAGYTSGREPERWPRPGEELVLNVTGVSAAQSVGTPAIRDLALEPWKFEGQTVTVVGQFRGRNLFGDLPGAPALSRWDFVLRSADGVLWVTGQRPRGRGFDLDVEARVDTNRWLEVTGTVRRERSLVILEATRLAATTARTEAPVEPPAPPPPPPAPIQVVFSSPTPEEVDVLPTAPVRIQFSRGLNPSTVAAGFTVRYVGGEATTAPAFRTAYDVATRAVELRFAEPLESFRTLRVDTVDTLRGFDGATIEPWSVTFSIGR